MKIKLSVKITGQIHLKPVLLVLPCLAIPLIKIGDRVSAFRSEIASRDRLRFARAMHPPDNEFFPAFSAFAQWHHAMALFGDESGGAGKMPELRLLWPPAGRGGLLADAEMLRRRLFVESATIFESREFYEVAQDRPALQPESYRRMQQDAARLLDLHDAVCRIDRALTAHLASIQPGTENPNLREIARDVRHAVELWNRWHQLWQPQVNGNDSKTEGANPSIRDSQTPGAIVRTSPMPEPTPEAIDQFIAKWSVSGGHERGSGQYFLLDFCDLLGLEKPGAPVPENELNGYTFERRVDRRKPDGTSAPNWIDLYKSGHFVLETKQGVNSLRDKSDPDQPLLPALAAPASKSAGHGQRGSSLWDKALERAHKQAERYIHLLPVDEGRPPFLIVCDVGHCFDLYAEFSGTGGQYEAFPDPRSRRILLKDLHEPAIRDLFRKIWHDPRSLDPSKHAAAVTREVAKALADLAKSLEKDGHDPQVTAGFLQRCLFTMFAEDIGLLPDGCFADLLRVAKESPHGLPVLLQGLWADMATGTQFSATIRAAIPHFNGGLFKDTSALPLRADQIVYLLHAAKQDWAAVEPAIFGTLLERALDPRERHKLGAHYTPRSYVERLVRPTLIEPLREKWEAVKAAAAQLDDKGKTKEARAEVEKFHHELAAVRVLDPACGSGNFLYVALELLKRLEAEVLDLFEQLGGNRSFESDHFNLRPTNFLGIELNPRAAAIAQLVLWIGYFQWHKRTTGRADTNDRPLLPKVNTIECRDAVLAYDEKIPRRDPATGEIVTIWDGRTTKPHPVTGKEVPDETARTVVFDYVNPRRAEWPEADYIVGNPPFIGASRMREALGDGYVETLRKTWKGIVPESADLVMYWWAKGAEFVRDKNAARFGFITTNSIHQTFNRRVIEPFLADGKTPVHLTYAIPDHPWVDSVDGADVRIAMTIAAPGNGEGVLDRVTEESPHENGENEVVFVRSAGTLAPNLQVGAKLSSTLGLRSNCEISSRGHELGSSGFIVTPEESERLKASSSDYASNIIRPYLNGRDLTERARGVLLIDAHGLEESSLCELHPGIYQHLLNRVKPERATNKDARLRDFWWLHRRSREDLRKMAKGLGRFIATVETSKHRFFVFLEHQILPDNKLIVIASDSAFHLALLSSQIHLTWALATGSRLGVGNDPVYVKTRCFEAFPFPALEDGELKQRIRDLGERLDAHRKARQAAHPDLTLTGMYNVLEKLRAEEPLTDKDKKIHDQGLVSILKQLHDELDAAVFEAYGWQDLHAAMEAAGRGTLVDLNTGTTAQLDVEAGNFENAIRAHEEALEQVLLTRLVALNHERAAEEKKGLIRWLRPEYQAPAAPVAQQAAIDLPAEKGEVAVVEAKPVAWPATLAAQFAAVRSLLPATGPNAEALSAHFGKKNAKRTQQIQEILDTLVGIGQL